MFFVIEYDKAGKGAYVFQCDTASEGREYLYDMRGTYPDLSAILCDGEDGDRVIATCESGIRVTDAWPEA